MHGAHTHTTTCLVAAAAASRMEGEWAAPSHGDGHDEKTRRMAANANGDSYTAALTSRAAEL